MNLYYFKNLRIREYFFLDDEFHFAGRTSECSHSRFFKRNKTLAHSKAIIE